MSGLQRLVAHGVNACVRTHAVNSSDYTSARTHAATHCLVTDAEAEDRVLMPQRWGGEGGSGDGGGGGGGF